MSRTSALNCIDSPSEIVRLSERIRWPISKILVEPVLRVPDRKSRVVGGHVARVGRGNANGRGEGHGLLGRSVWQAPDASRVQAEQALALAYGAAQGDRVGRRHP